MKNSAMVNMLPKFTFYRGRVALFSILKALGIRAGDHVITQAFTCVAVPEAIMATGAIPVYSDIKKQNFNMNPNHLKTIITPETKAIIVQHTFGIPAEIEEIDSIAKEYNVPIIEDCCHTLTSTYNNNAVGRFGVASFYSYEWGKPIVAGIGGSALINDACLLKEMEHLYRHLGEPPLDLKVKLEIQYYIFRLVYRPILFWPARALFHMLSRFGVLVGNYNPIDDMGLSDDFTYKMSSFVKDRLGKQLNQINYQAKYSQKLIDAYQAKIQGNTIALPILPSLSSVVLSRYPIMVRDKQMVLRMARKYNVELAGWYSTPIHPLEKKDWHKVYYTEGLCPNAEEVCDQVVTLPVHKKVTKSYVRRAVKLLRMIDDRRDSVSQSRERI